MGVKSQFLRFLLYEDAVKTRFLPTILTQDSTRAIGFNSFWRTAENEAWV
jgi:hypothetical protein